MKFFFEINFAPKFGVNFGVKTPEGEQKSCHQTGPGYTTKEIQPLQNYAHAIRR